MVDMAILTMVVITHMITKPLTMVMANLTMLLAMQKVQDQAFITLKIICPLMDTQEYILNTKVNMISIHQEALVKAHTCKTMQELMMITEIFFVPEIEYQVPTTTFPSGSYSIKGKQRQSQDFGQSPHSEIPSFKGKERQYQDFEESLDGDKSKDKQTPLQGYEDI
ncbi:hypothetical protein PPACK8108_LOCUS8791, partial [Phakopsora pachyrhizi]